FIHEPLSHNTASDGTKTVGICSFPFVESEGLFIKITEEMKRFYAHISSFDGAFQESPEILHTISMYGAVYIGFCMVNKFMHVIRFKTLVRNESVSIQFRSLFYILPYLLMDNFSASAGNHCGLYATRLFVLLRIVVQRVNNFLFALLAFFSSL